MNMTHKESIVEQLKTVIAITEKEVETRRSYIALKEANDFYNKLLENGITQKRGFTLRGIEDSHLFHAKLNGN